MRVRNITDVKARTLTGVKATPDWRFILFVGAVRQDPDVETADLNMWVVGATQTKAERMAPILAPQQITALQTQCRSKAAEMLNAGIEQKRKEAEAIQATAGKKEKEKMR